MFRYDESDPTCLIAYTGPTHPEPADYRDLLARWQQWIEKGQRFGLILVTEPHTHEEGFDYEKHREEEAEISQLMTEFRHKYREVANKSTTGYVRVADEAEMRPYIESQPGGLDHVRAGQERFARYTFGVRGNVAYTVDEARNWLKEIHSLPALPLDDAGSLLAGRVGLFFGSTTGVTEYVAEEIASAWQAKGFEPLSAVNIGSVKDLARLLDYDYLILGIPTWNIGELQDDWDIAFPDLDDLNFAGRKVAIFGIGDQYGYPDNFLDAAGMLGTKLEERGAQLVGFTDAGIYEFSESLAKRGDKLICLGIDDVSEPNETAPRVENWVAQIIGEFALEPVQ